MSYCPCNFHVKYRKGNIFSIFLSTAPYKKAQTFLSNVTS